MTPLRLIILQFSQSFLTEARTFIFLNLSRFHQKPAGGQVVRRHFQPDLIATIKMDSVSPGFSRDKRHKAMTIYQFHLIRTIAQNLDDYAFNFEAMRSGHVRISGSASVMSTVCSK